MTSPLPGDNPAPNSNCTRVCIPFSLYDPELHTLNGVYATEEECLAACECAESSSSSVSGQSSSSVSGQSSSSVSGQSSSSNEPPALACFSAINTYNIDPPVASGPSWFDVAHGNNKFVAVRTNVAGGAVSAVRSADGATWEYTTLLNADLINIEFNGSFFLATTPLGDFTYKSVDGNSWTEYSSQISPPVGERLYWLGGKFVQVKLATYNGASTLITTSTDGENWGTPVSINSNPENGAYIHPGIGPYRRSNLAYYNDAYYILGTGAPDGTSPQDLNDLPSITRVPVVARSSDGGATWSILAVNGLSAVPNIVAGFTGQDAIPGWGDTAQPPEIHLTYGDNKFVAIINASLALDKGASAYSRYITATSTDGINWAATENETLSTAMYRGGSTTATTDINDFKYLNNKFVVVTGGTALSCDYFGRILCSADGVSWAVSSEFDSVWRGVTSGTNLTVVAVGSVGACIENGQAVIGGLEVLVAAP